MRILHVIPTLSSEAGGSREACLSLCRELTRQGHEATVYSTDLGSVGKVPPKLYEPVELEGVQVRFFPVQRPRSYVSSYSLANALRRDIPSFDIVHIHSLYRFHFVVATWLCRLYGVPYLIKPHGSLDPFLFRTRRSVKWVHEVLFERPAFKRAAGVHFTALEEMTLAASTGVFGSAVDQANLTIPNGVIIPEGVDLDPEAQQADPAAFLARYPESRGKKRILCLGRVNFKKGLDILARAFAILCKQRDDLQLVIAGPDDEGYGRQVRGWLEEGGVSGRTTWTGMLVGSEKFAAFKAADIFVLPSYTENFGYVIVEAMSMGVPVVTTNKVNIWKEIAEAQAGVIVNCDPQEVAAAVSTLLENAELARAMARRAKILATETFSIASAGAQALRVYEEILRRTSSGARSAMGGAHAADATT